MAGTLAAWRACRPRRALLLCECVCQHSSSSGAGGRVAQTLERERLAGSLPGICAALGTGAVAGLVAERELRSGCRVLAADKDVAIVRDRACAALCEVEDPSLLEFVRRRDLSRGHVTYPSA